MKIKVNELLFWIAYGLLLITTMFSRVEIVSKYSNILDGLSLIVLMISCAFNFKTITKKELFFFPFIFILLFISYRVSHSSFIFKMFLFIYSSKALSFDHSVKIDFKIRLFFFLTILLLHFLGFTNDYITVRPDGTMRNSMGFSHPNIFGFYIIILCLEFLYLKNFKVDFKGITILILLTLLIDYFADSRASTVIMILIILISLFHKNFVSILSKQNSKHLIIRNLVLFLSFFTLMIVAMYRNYSDFAIFVNKLTTNRIWSISLFYNKYGIHLFGSQLTLVSTETAALLNTKAYILDSCYANLIIQYGLFVYVIVCVLFRKGFDRLFASKNYNLILIFVLLLFYGLVENSILKISYNFFLLYFAELIRHNKEVTHE